MIDSVEVRSSEQLQIASEADVATYRRRAREVAMDLGLDTFAVAAITTAASELSRNALVHGGGGVGDIESVRGGGRLGLRLRLVDEGPGIPDVQLAMRGGFTTGRSLGLGLPGSQRLVDEFDICSEPGKGTTVEVVKWARFRR
ncbi:MAG: anti-sigma regulatory factor [Myxococcales bacterium]|nr:anti-sigma regulatory factor [Myxococcales bacterium]